MMTVPTNEALSRPLFEEPTADIERADEWSEPHGFLFDAMNHPTSLDLSRQFLDAADQLVERVRRQECEDFRVTFPALFLYRHAVELVLKCAIGDEIVCHKLDALADLLVKRRRAKYWQAVPAWIVQRLNELARFDPTSTAFRYAETGGKKPMPLPWMLEGAHVDLYHLQRVMTALHTALADMVGTLDSGSAP